MKYIIFVFSIFVCFYVNANVPKQYSSTVLSVAAPEIHPFIYKNAAGENDGLIIDTIKKLNNQGDFKISVQIMPWARAIKEVQNGNLDALMPTVYTAERSLSLSFPEDPLINFHGSELFIRADDDFIYRSVPLINKGKIIVKVRSVKIERDLEQEFLDANITFIEVTRLEDAFKMLIHKRADLLVSDSIIAQSTIKKMAINHQVKGISLTGDVTPSFLAFSKQYAESHDINILMKKINVINNPNKYRQLSQE